MDALLTRLSLLSLTSTKRLTGARPSVLARASFETPLKHIVNAATIGEADELNSVIENVMLNQPVPVGTGLPGLATKIRK